MPFFVLLWIATKLTIFAGAQTTPDDISAKVMQVKDQHGAVVMEVGDINLWRYSQMLKQNVQGFKCTVRNVSGEPLANSWLVAVWRLKDGTTREFMFAIATGTIFAKDATYRADLAMRETLYTPETLKAYPLSQQNGGFLRRMSGLHRRRRLRRKPNVERNGKWKKTRGRHPKKSWRERSPSNGQKSGKRSATPYI